MQILQFLPYFDRAGIVYTHIAIYSDNFYHIQNRMRSVSRIRRDGNFLLGIIAAYIKKCMIAWQAPSYDTVVIQREVFPRILYWILRQRNPRIIYEIEDTIYELNAFWEDGIVRSFGLRYQARLCRNMMRHAAHIIVENEYHAAEARTYGHDVSFITAPIDTGRVHPGPSHDSSTVTLGWIGGTPTTALLEQLQPVFRAIGTRFPQAQLLTVGAALQFRAKGIPHEHLPWSEESEVALLQRMDIGLMPLDDAPFNKGRLGYKMIQYMSVGIPIVADHIGLNSTVVRDGENGFLVSSEAEWIEKIGMLILDRGLRERMGKAGWNIAEERYAITRQAENFIRTVQYVGKQK